MVKEDLYLFVKNDLSCNVNQLKSKLDEFFETNVVIPKGKERHPYADVFHELAEDVTKGLEEDINHFKSNGMYPSEWLTVTIPLNKLRIKPSNPER